LRKAYLGNLWIGPAAGMIDPVKETVAAQARVDGFFSNISIESAAMGIDFDQNIKQIAREQKKLQAIRQMMAPPVETLSAIDQLKLIEEEERKNNKDDKEEDEDDNKK
jgi:capsid protein